MARRRDNSAIGMLFEIVAWLPWPVGVGLGIFTFIFMRFILPGTLGDDQFAKMFKPILCHGLISYAAGGILVVIALISALKRAEKRQLFGAQKNLANIRDLSWRDFETYIGEAFRQQGYEVEETGGGGADGGIDLILQNEHETVLVQCKQWRNRQVKVNVVREMYGLLQAESASRVIIATSGDFSPDARAFADDKPIELLSGRRLEQMVFGAKNNMARSSQPAVRTNNRQVRSPATPTPPVASATTSATSSTKMNAPTGTATPACPTCKAPMKLRTAKQGPTAGNQFYGCSRYPQCRGIVQVVQEKIRG